MQSYRGSHTTAVLSMSAVLSEPPTMHCQATRGYRAAWSACLTPSFHWHSTATYGVWMVGQAEFIWVACYIPRWFTRITHFSIKQVQHTATSSIKTHTKSRTTTQYKCKAVHTQNHVINYKSFHLRRVFSNKLSSRFTSGVCLAINYEVVSHPACV